MRIGRNLLAAGAVQRTAFGGGSRAARVTILLFVLAVAIPMSSQGAGNPVVVGKIVSSETGEPLPYANVGAYRLEAPSDSVGTQAGGVMTKSDGSYRLALPAGTYKFLIGYISYHPKWLGPVALEAGRNLTMDTALIPSAIRLDAIDVKAKAITGNATSVLARQRKAVAVSDGISGQEIKRNSDANAAEALQRVTGLTLVSGRYVYVRGLGERYSSTQVNGANVGTPEPNKKVVPLDLFASGLLDNVVVQKTYTPDQPGEFGGGVINLTTMDFPGRRIADMSFSLGWRGRTTGEDFYSYDGGSLGFLGLDDGTRAMPKTIEQLASGRKITSRSAVTHEGFSPDTLAMIGRSFSQTWAPEKGTAIPAYAVSGTYGNEVEIGERSLGFLGSVSLSNSYSTTESKDAFYKSDGGLLTAETAYDVTSSEHTTLWGTVASSSYQVADYSTISVRSIYNHSAEDETRFYEGDNEDTGKPLQNTRIQFVQRNLFSGSVASSSVLPNLGRSTLDLRFNYSKAHREEPDRREYTYERESVVSYDEDDEPIDTLDVWVLSKRSASLGMTRMFGRMKEEERGPDATLSIPFRQWSGMDSKAKIGFSYRNKDRDSSWRRFYFREPSYPRNLDRISMLSQSPEEFMTDEMIGGTSGTFVITELTKQDTDNYRAHQNVTAGFAMVDVPIRRQLRAVVGARVEKSVIRVDSYDVFGQWPDSLLSHSHLDDTDILPSVNVTYAPSEAMNIRLAYSTTVSRPDMRELSPFFLTDFVSGYPEQGNPELKRAKIHNYDLRLENFLELNELVAASLFYKKLIHPIEKALLGGSAPTYMPINAESGYVVGAELESRIGLRRIHRGLSGWDGNANFTLVKSETDLGEAGVQTSRRRPLEGQSPYVVNLGVHYDAVGSQTKAGLVYNVFGRRLHLVGVSGLPDIYECPRHSLDFSLARRVSSMTLKLAVGNILDAESRYEQEQEAIPGIVAGGFRTTHLEREGRSVSLSISTNG